MAKRYDPILCMMVDEPTKAQDVAPATQRYINTIVDESKSNAEKFVRQAEQDDEVPENELKYVYKAYNEKFGYKFHDSDKTKDAEFQMYGPEFHHPIIKASSKEEAIKKAKEIYGWGGKVEAVKVSDSASALDEAIKTADGATGDKLYADVKAIYSLFSNILLTYSNEQSVQKLATEGTKKCLELAAKVKGVRDEAIKACDAVEVETSKWSFSSGKSKPSGFGNWWFKIGTEEKNFSGNWSSAKAEAIKYAKEKGISRISLMT